MADNFLEKHYQEYQARKASMGQSQRTTKKKSAVARLKKNVWISDGNTSIGKALVQAFCMEDCKVAFCSTNKEEGLLLAKETGAAFFHLEELRTEEFSKTMEAVMKRWGSIDILIMNSAQSCSLSSQSDSVDAFNQIVTENLRSYLSLSQQWEQQNRESMDQDPYGRILLVCPPTFFQTNEVNVCDRLSIQGIHALTQSLALNPTQTGMTTNTISPLWNAEQSETRHPEGVAHLCVFLSQPENGGVNGENLKVHI